MSKKKKPFASQLKTLVSIEESIEKLIAQQAQKKRKGAPKILFRSVFKPHTPTTYTTENVGKNTVIYGDNKDDGGLKEGDFLISDANPDLVLESKKHGLSFSATTQKTMDTLQFLGKFQKKGTVARIAYWINEESQTIPNGLKFEVDERDSEHYLLTVTKEMTVTQLISKLKFVGQRLAVMNDLPLEVFKP